MREHKSTSMWLEALLGCLACDNDAVKNVVFAAPYQHYVHSPLVTSLHQFTPPPFYDAQMIIFININRKPVG